MPISFQELIAKWSGADSLEQGNSQYTRYNVFSKRGQKALERYQKAVGIMKEYDQNPDNFGYPYSWLTQASIHGSFWTSIEQLLMNAAAQANQQGFGSKKQIKAGDTVINNCTHFSNLWQAAKDNYIANQKAEGSEPTWSENIPDNITINFLSWHRLYLSNHEKVVRQVLKDNNINGWKKWALPYWEYTASGQDKAPEIFTEKTLGNGSIVNPLFEESRSVRINQGEGISEMLQPRSTMGLATELSEGEAISIFKFQKRGVEKALDQTIFSAFSTYNEQNPHNNMHDALGGIADYQQQTEYLWEKTSEYGWQDNVQLWDYDPFAIDKGLPGARENYPDIFGPKPTMGPGLMGFVPAAARDPIFWVHHAYIDKIWSHWNASSNAAYLQEASLEQNPWNYVFYEPGKNGKPKKNVISKWGTNSAEVISETYYPNYVYDNLSINEGKSHGSPNPALAVLDSPDYMPVINTQVVDQSIKRMAYGALALDIPFNAKNILSLEKQEFSIIMDIEYTCPMNASQDIGMLVGGKEFFRLNKQSLKGFWNSWDQDHQTFTDPSFGSIFDKRGGTFNPQNIENLNVGGINLLPMAAKTTSNMEGSAMGMAEMPMTSQLTIDLSDLVSRQQQFNLTSNKTKLALFVTADKNNEANTKTTIDKITYRLHRPTSKPGKEGNFTDFDTAAFLADNPDLLTNRKVLRNPRKYHEKNQSTFEGKDYSFESRAEEIGAAYLSANPNVAARIKSEDPIDALNHYLEVGMQNGNSLLPANSFAAS